MASEEAHRAQRGTRVVCTEMKQSTWQPVLVVVLDNVVRCEHSRVALRACCTFSHRIVGAGSAAVHVAYITTTHQPYGVLRREGRADCARRGFGGTAPLPAAAPRDLDAAATAAIVSSSRTPHSIASCASCWCSVASFISRSEASNASASSSSLRTRSASSGSKSNQSWWRYSRIFALDLLFLVEA